MASFWRWENDFVKFSCPSFHGTDENERKPVLVESLRMLLSCLCHNESFLERSFGHTLQCARKWKMNRLEFCELFFLFFLSSSCVGFCELDLIQYLNIYNKILPNLAEWQIRKNVGSHPGAQLQKTGKKVLINVDNTQSTQGPIEYCQPLEESWFNYATQDMACRVQRSRYWRRTSNENWFWELCWQNWKTLSDNCSTTQCECLPSVPTLVDDFGVLRA